MGYHSTFASEIRTLLLTDGHSSDRHPGLCLERWMYYG